MPRDTVFRYRPPQSLRWVVVACFALFLAVVAVMLWTGQGPLWLVSAVGLAAFAALGVVEVFVSHVELDANTLRVRRLLRKETIPLDEVVRVSGEEGGVALQLAAGGWRRLPDWLGGRPARSLQQRLRHRISRRPPSPAEPELR